MVRNFDIATMYVSQAPINSTKLVDIATADIYPREFPPRGETRAGMWGQQQDESRPVCAKPTRSNHINHTQSLTATGVV